MKTKVYVVIQGWDYEGEIIKGIFKDKAKADEFAGTLSKEIDHQYGYVNVEEYTLHE